MSQLKPEVAYRSVPPSDLYCTVCITGLIVLLTMLAFVAVLAIEQVFAMRSDDAIHERSRLERRIERDYAEPTITITSVMSVPQR